MWTAYKYTLFALTAILVNLISQDIIIRVYTGIFSLYVSIFLGTLIGLLVKYILDKKYIFSFQTIDLTEDGKKFILYSLMGVGTTLVFWGFELSFDYLFQTKIMRYTGAALGLTIGYTSKYYLDKHFVFVRSA